MTSAPDATRRLVALQLPAGLGALQAIEDARQGGAAVLPIDPRASDRVVKRVLEEMRPSEIITTDGRAALEGGEPVADDVAFVLLTSGTTGEPKGAELTEDAVIASVRAGLERIGGAAGDRWLCCLPLHHVAGILVLLRARELGTLPIVHPRFVPEAVAAEKDATHVALVPTMLARLVDLGAALGGFSRILVGGGPVDDRLLEQARALGAEVSVTYGMTETSGGCVYDGVPLDGVEVDVAEDGRIRVRGPVLMRGYRRRPDLTARAIDGGWLTTRDLGAWDRGGRLLVTGRADDTIITGGENVSAQAVAEAAVTHPGVAEAVAEGRPDPDLGERIVVVCVAEDPESPPGEQEVRDCVAERLGRHAAPREVRFVDALLVTASERDDT